MTGGFRKDRTPRPAFRTHREALAVPEGVRVRHSRPAPPVTVLRVLPEVWRLAMRLAGGNVYRLEVVDEGCCVVHNREDWRRHGQAIGT